MNLRWHHPTTCSSLTIELVASRHSQSLKAFLLQNTCKCWADSVNLRHSLSTLHVPDLYPDSSINWIARLVAQNSPVLSSIKIGIEDSLYSMTREELQSQDPSLFTTHFSRSIQQEFTHFRQSQDKRINNELAPDAILSHKSLHLIGVGFTNLAEPRLSRLFDFNNLQSLCLESCDVAMSSNLPLNLLTVLGHAHSSWIICHDSEASDSGMRHLIEHSKNK